MPPQSDLLTPSAPRSYPERASQLTRPARVAASSMRYALGRLRPNCWAAFVTFPPHSLSAETRACISLSA